VPSKRVAIIDIGSNSVRLVVYGAMDRVPTPIFNEKVLAGLGKAVGKTGAISQDSWDCAITELKRFRRLLRHMDVRQVKVVATAAVRDASNGAEFVAEIDRLGLDCRVVSAEEEAWLAGEGVLSGFPDADGIAGDLGGGSLELVDVRGGKAGNGISLPLGVLRIGPGGLTEKQAEHILSKALRESGLIESGRGRNFYMVGGSWRALAKLDMRATGYPLPVLHGYSIDPARIGSLRHLLSDPSGKFNKAIPSARLATAPVAAMLLSHVNALLRPRSLLVSSLGIREGLLYSELKPAIRAQDPLIGAIRSSAVSGNPFEGFGEALDSWIAPMFADPPELARIRKAACLLAESASWANPDFRADRGLELALHGNWTGITPGDRVMMGQALSSNFGRDKLIGADILGLCPGDKLRRAHHWGLAMRLGQRLSAGVQAVLELTRLKETPTSVELHVPRRDQALLADNVLRRLSRLSEALGKSPEVVVD
jgi:exopolyphosphatase / guanosine-5'-triphosphate,3'-diphosphate pyrophosphatase